MWFPENIRKLGSVEIAAFKSAVLAAPESVWRAGDATKAKLAGNRPTQSIFFKNLDPDNYQQLITERAVLEGDVDVVHSGEISALLQPILNKVINKLAQPGIVVRAQLARMQPGAKISPHYDSSPILLASHRLHIPILTHNKLRFTVGGQRVLLQEGQLYELNNQLEHSVHNPNSASTRIHLIIDILPDDLNRAGMIDDRLEFTVRARQMSHLRAASPSRAKSEAAILEGITLPTVLATSVVRGSHKSESHGGVYRVDMASGHSTQVVDWNNCDIDFSGRGWDRGLRGICYVGSRILIASTDHIYEFDHQFKIVNAFNNAYLRHAHEMVCTGKFIFITSTGFDSIIRFDIKRQAFDKGWQFISDNGQLALNIFDPLSMVGPVESNLFHINNIAVDAACSKDEFYMSGRKLGFLVKISGNQIVALDRLPPGTHNVMPFNKGILYNDSERDQVVYSHDYDYRAIDVPVYDESLLSKTELGDKAIARQAFGRGLCHFQAGLVIGGSSPSTLSLYDLKTRQKLKSVNISMDIRNAIHGLELWPF